MKQETSGASQLTPVEVKVIETFVELVKLLGLPKSLGEIYGLLYLSPIPLSMDQIIAKLNISLGSASQGLRQLKAFKAVKSPYIPGERKEFFEAELELRKLIAGFLKEEVFPFLDSSHTKLKDMKSCIDQNNEENCAYKEQMLENLTRWHSLSEKWLKRGVKFMKI